MNSYVTRGSPAADLVVRRDASRVVLVIRGDLDLATVADLRERLLRAMTHLTCPVVVDLAGVTFCGAEGLALLVHVRRRARLLGLTFCLANPSAQTRRVMEVTGLWRCFAILAVVPMPGMGLVAGQPAA